MSDQPRSPLSDPWALSTSAIFHVLLMIGISVAAYRWVQPSTIPASRVIQADLKPVDNRAPAETGGGGPGEIGGEGKRESVPLRIDREIDDSRERGAEALLAEALPRAMRSEQPTSVEPGELTRGIGILPGEGLGGGGGSGGGSGGGIGKGLGPSTEFFGAREYGLSFAYVIDCSGSMSKHGALDRAERELMASLEQLPPDAQFSVIFYNLSAVLFADEHGRTGLMPATAANKDRVKARLAEIKADGGTDHVRAIEAAFALKPEVVFFLTDAREMSPEQADRLLEQAGKARVQAIEFGDGPDPGTVNALKTLASGTGGAYRYVDVSKNASRGG